MLQNDKTAAPSCSVDCSTYTVEILITTASLLVATLAVYLVFFDGSALF